METNTTQITYWTANNGELSCSQHGGHYLSLAIENRPNAKTHRTPITTWTRLANTEVEMFKKEYGYCCETCNFGAK